MKTLRLALILIFCLAGLAGAETISLAPEAGPHDIERDGRESAIADSGVENLPGPSAITPAAPDPAYDYFTWTLPSSASSVRLSLPTDISNFLFNDHGGIGGYGLCGGGHIEGLDHVWIEFIPGTPAQSMAPGTVTAVTLNGEPPDQEYHIWIDYGDNLIGIHMEIMTSYVSVGDTVTRGQQVGMGMSFDTNQTSGEIGMIDRGRTDGAEAWGGGTTVSPFDYLRDADKQVLVNAYKADVIQPYQNDGTLAWGFEPQQPYLTNKLRLHDGNEGKLTGGWYLPSKDWAHGYPNDIMTFVEADNPYFTNTVIKSQDRSGSRGDPWSLHGTCEVDYVNGKIKLYTEYVSPHYHYGIFEIDETGSRATLRIEYQTNSYPAGFSTNALTYTAREYYTGNVDIAASSLIFLPASIAAGAHPTYTAFVIQNNGPDYMPADSVSYDFYLSRNETFNESEAVLIGSLNDTLQMAIYSNVTTTLNDASLTNLTIPSDATGNYYVFVQVRAATVGDPDLSNNITRRSGVISIENGAGSPYIPLTGDFDGDGKTDPALYQESSGAWSVMLSASGYGIVTTTLGGSGYDPITKDFDGDGKADPGVYNETDGNWTVLLSANGYGIVTLSDFGGVGYVTVVGDYDGDGKADPAVYYEAAGSWEVKMSKSSYATVVLLSFGGVGYSALALDFDGDGQVDPVIYNTTSGYWIIKLSGSSYTPTYITSFGGTGYTAVVGDYDADGKVDPAIYNTSTGDWTVRLSGSSYTKANLWGFGGPGYTAVVGDYDGDGKADPALYRESTSTWSVKLSASDYATATATQ